MPDSTALDLGENNNEPETSTAPPECGHAFVEWCQLSYMPDPIPFVHSPSTNVIHCGANRMKYKRTHDGELKVECLSGCISQDRQCIPEECKCLCHILATWHDEKKEINNPSSSVASELS